MYLFLSICGKINLKEVPTFFLKRFELFFCGLVVLRLDKRIGDQYMREDVRKLLMSKISNNRFFRYSTKNGRIKKRVFGDYLDSRFYDTWEVFLAKEMFRLERLSFNSSQNTDYREQFLRNADFSMTMGEVLCTDSKASIPLYDVNSTAFRSKIFNRGSNKLDNTRVCRRTYLTQVGILDDDHAPDYYLFGFLGDISKETSVQVAIEALATKVSDELVTLDTNDFERAFNRIAEKMANSRLFNELYDSKIILQDMRLYIVSRFALLNFIDQKQGAFFMEQLYQYNSEDIFGNIKPVYTDDFIEKFGGKKLTDPKEFMPLALMKQSDFSVSLSDSLQGKAKLKALELEARAIQLTRIRKRSAAFLEDMLSKAPETWLLADYAEKFYQEGIEFEDIAHSSSFVIKNAEDDEEVAINDPITFIVDYDKTAHATMYALIDEETLAKLATSIYTIDVNKSVTKIKDLFLDEWVERQKDDLLIDSMLDLVNVDDSLTDLDAFSDIRYEDDINPGGFE